jgi:hypothetical protein
MDFLDQVGEDLIYRRGVARLKGKIRNAKNEDPLFLKYHFSSEIVQTFISEHENDLGSLPAHRAT